MVAQLLKIGNGPSQFRHNDINALLVPLINWRSKTVDLKVGMAKSLKVCNYWSYLLNNMQAYPRRSDRGCATFFMNNRFKILEIMPGQRSPMYRSFMEKFEAADIAARRLLSMEETYALH